MSTAQSRSSQEPQSEPVYILDGASPHAARSIDAFKSFQSIVRWDMLNLSLYDLHALGSAIAEVANTLKRECNARAAIHKLPPEILAHILHYVRAPESRVIQDIRKVYDLTPPPDFKSLVRATHVCRQWRSVATNCPSLWSVLPDLETSYPIMDAFFGRSGTLPLEVHISTTGAYSGYPTQDRNRIVALVSSAPDCSCSLLPTVAHSLKYLEVRSASPYHRRRDDWPIITFSPETPRLHALSLNLRTGASVDDFFPDLAHLRITGGNHKSLRVHALLKLLANTPRLETLYILHTELEHNDDSDALPTVPLNHLRTLCVDSPGYSGASALMKYLTFPSTTSIQLHRLDVTNHTSLGTVLHLPPLAELTVLEVAEEPCKLHIRVRGPRGGGLWLHVVARYAKWPRKILGSVLDKLFGALAGVTEVRVAGTSAQFRLGLLDAVVQEVTARLPDVLTLVVACDSVQDTMEALARSLSPGTPLVETPGRADTSVGVPSEVQVSALPFPALDTLRTQASHSDPTSMLHDEDLNRMLSFRASRRRPIRAVTLSGGRQASKVREDARPAFPVEEVEMVEEMVWDMWNDPFWKVRNEYWPLHPDESDSVGMSEFWGLPRVGFAD
ncbi:hypothetical protein C8Q76DRAFT_800202 [Earliella scabrosa]|nr:hypothetical protein C8Q76DRAFT_800202 [Earliella scabrosa]